MTYEERELLLPLLQIAVIIMNATVQEWKLNELKNLFLMYFFPILSSKLLGDAI